MLFRLINAAIAAVQDWQKDKVYDLRDPYTGEIHTTPNRDLFYDPHRKDGVKDHLYFDFSPVKTPNPTQSPEATAPEFAKASVKRGKPEKRDKPRIPRKLKKKLKREDACQAFDLEA
ncbi:MAG: hypothetical protein ACT4OY_02435 [Alphaproteobacteria bacterium]